MSMTGNWTTCLCSAYVRSPFERFEIYIIFIVLLDRFSHLPSREESKRHSGLGFILIGQTFVVSPVAPGMSTVGGHWQGMASRYSSLN
jgi:hypothetical protein